MAYRFEADEQVTEGSRRCATEQVDRAVHELVDKVPVDPVDGLHSARKALKKERSLLRLLRASMTGEERRRANASFRSAARKLSNARDSEVMIQAVDQLAEQYSGQLPKPTLIAVREHLAARADAARRRLGQSGITEEVAEQLRAARTRPDEWKLTGNGWDAVAPGLRRSYRQGRKAFEQARSKPTDDHLHAWRKRAKDLWYELRLLSAVAPHTVKGQAKDAHLLSDLLGDDHDLAVLRESLVATPGQIPVDLDPVLALIGHRREQLQQEAFFLASRLYAERPKAFVRRIGRYWNAWRAEAQAVEAQRPAELANATRTAAIA
jgi:CHAD domain-containing protein